MLYFCQLDFSLASCSCSVLSRKVEIPRNWGYSFHIAMVDDITDTVRDSINVRCIEVSVV